MVKNGWQPTTTRKNESNQKQPKWIIINIYPQNGWIKFPARVDSLVIYGMRTALGTGALDAQPHGQSIAGWSWQISSDHVFNHFQSPLINKWQSTMSSVHYWNVYSTHKRKTYTNHFVFQTQDLVVYTQCFPFTSNDHGGWCWASIYRQPSTVHTHKITQIVGPKRCTPETLMHSKSVTICKTYWDVHPHLVGGHLPWL